MPKPPSIITAIFFLPLPSSSDRVVVAYLSYVLGDEAAHHHALVVDEQVGLGLGGTVEGHLLEPQLVVRYAPYLLGLWGPAHTHTHTRTLNQREGRHTTA